MISRARIAMDVAARKEKRPELFCPFRKCLWRTGDGSYCPRHKTAAPAKPATPATIQDLRTGDQVVVGHRSYGQVVYRQPAVVKSVTDDQIHLEDGTKWERATGWELLRRWMLDTTLTQSTMRRLELPSQATI